MTGRVYHAPEGLTLTETDPNTLEGVSQTKKTKPNRGEILMEVNEKPGSLEGIDLEKLRVSQDFEGVSVKPILNVVPVRKPNKQEFFRTVSGEEWVFPVRILEDKEGNKETYLVAPELQEELDQELKPVSLYTCYNRLGKYFLVPVMLPREGRQNSWHESLQQAIVEAKNSWIRAVADQSVGGYNIIMAYGNIKEPELPEVSGIMDLIKIAFRNRYIDSYDHPVLKRLRGEN